MQELDFRKLSCRVRFAVSSHSDSRTDLNCLKCIETVYSQIVEVFFPWNWEYQTIPCKHNEFTRLTVGTPFLPCEAVWDIQQ